MELTTNPQRLIIACSKFEFENDSDVKNIDLIESFIVKFRPFLREDQEYRDIIDNTIMKLDIFKKTPQTIPSESSDTPNESAILEKNYIQSLPPEILSIIFQFLYRQDLLRLANSCKFFSQQIKSFLLKYQKDSNTKKLESSPPSFPISGKVISKITNNFVIFFQAPFYRIIDRVNSKIVNSGSLAEHSPSFDFNWNEVADFTFLNDHFVFVIPSAKKILVFNLRAKHNGKKLFHEIVIDPDVKIMCCTSVEKYSFSFQDRPQTNTLFLAGMKDEEEGIIIIFRLEFEVNYSKEIDRFTIDQVFKPFLTNLTKIRYFDNKVILFFLGKGIRY